jgi:hypothetical protein
MANNAKENQLKMVQNFRLAEKKAELKEQRQLKLINILENEKGKPLTEEEQVNFINVLENLDTQIVIHHLYFIGKDAPAVLKKKIEDIKKTCRDLIKQIDGLNRQQCLFPEGGISSLKEEARKIADGLKIKSVERRNESKENIALRGAVVHLLPLYEKLTGKKAAASYNRHKGMQTGSFIDLVRETIKIHDLQNWDRNDIGDKIKKYVGQIRASSN